MTKEETVKIMALLGAFYAGGKSEPKTQAQAWYMILYKYDFDIAKNAVLRYAENDTRDYATFPAVGRIVQAIKDEEAIRKKPVDEIIKGVSYGRDYDMLSGTAKALINREKYDAWLGIDAMEFGANAMAYADELKGKVLLDG